MFDPTAIPYELDSDRLALRAFEPGDALPLLAAVDEARVALERWLDWPARCRTPDDARAYCRQARGQFDLLQAFKFAVFHRRTEQLLGGVQLVVLAPQGTRVSVEYWIRPSQERRGFATEAVRALTGVAFGAGAGRLELAIEPNNRPSRQLAERVGYRKEGHLRSMPMRAGPPRDLIVYGMLPSDWHRIARGVSGVRNPAVREEELPQDLARDARRA